MKKLALSLIAVASLAACSSVPVKPDSTQAAPSTPIAQALPVVPKVPTSTNPLTDPNSILSKRSIYFDYDQYQVAVQYRSLIEAHANYLRSHPERKVNLEGNADERGSSEYNLALGQKRAEMVRKMMVTLGVSDKQLEAISYGKEKPKATGHDEAAWTQNRRTDIRYQGE